MLHFKLFELSVRLREALRRFVAYAKREAHHVQAFAYVLGAAVYQVVTAAGGFDAVRHWAWREWVARVLVTAGPAFLFLLRGKHNPVDPDAAAAVDAIRGKRDAP